jgi:hypothetical protein
MLHVLMNAAFELISIGVFKYPTCRLHLIEVERAKVLRVVTELHPSKPVKRILLELSYVKRGCVHLNTHLRLVEFVYSSPFHKILLELSLVSIT